MTRAGSGADAPAMSSACKKRVSWNTPFTLMSRTLSHAASSKSSNGAPQVAPALFTRMLSDPSHHSPTARARRRHSASVERSAGNETQLGPSSAATASQTSALRDEIATFAPASMKPLAIMRPIPRLPPVTSAVLPEISKRSLMPKSLNPSGGRHL